MPAFKRSVTYFLRSVTDIGMAIKASESLSRSARERMEAQQIKRHSANCL